MKKTLIVISLLLFILMVACDDGYNYNQGRFPDTPKNMEEFNSIFDDYNSAILPPLGQTFAFCFSTNRNSNGNNFDIIHMQMSVLFDRTSGVLEVSNEKVLYEDLADRQKIIDLGIESINTDSNELSPYIINNYDSTFIMLYSNDGSGNLDIKFIDNVANPDTFTTPTPINFLNTEWDDAYPSISSDYYLYFTSNREGGQFDIYKTRLSDFDLHHYETIVNALKDTAVHEISKVTQLSSGFDDKCPFVIKNTMIFTSNREGGYGGFDLYYSVFENGEWSAPINMGSKINTEYNEYRPIIIDFYESFTNNMLIFSSDRPNGMGGYDLYYVGTDILQ